MQCLDRIGRLVDVSDLASTCLILYNFIYSERDVGG